MSGAVNRILILKSRPHKNGKVLVKKGVLDAALLGLAPFTGGASAGLLAAIRGGQALRSAKKLGSLKTAQTGAQTELASAAGTSQGARTALEGAQKVPKLGAVDPHQLALRDLRNQAFGDEFSEHPMRSALQAQFQGAGPNPSTLTPSSANLLEARTLSTTNAAKNAERLANISSHEAASTAANTALTGAQTNLSNIGNRIGVLEAQIPAQNKLTRDAAIVTGTTGMGHGGANAAAQAEEARRLQERAAGAAAGTTGTHNMGSMNSSTG